MLQHHGYPVLSRDVRAATTVQFTMVGCVFAPFCRWDASTSCLADPAPGEMSCPLPVIHLVPHEAEGPPTSSTGSSSSSYPGNAAAEAQQVASPAANEAGSRPDGMFRCPVYKTPARAGVLGSSTGQSTNFLMHMQLPIPAHTSPARWWLQGVAVLCSLDE